VTRIDITAPGPRPAWFLALNPRGQVPTLSYDKTILVESATVARFLADAYPSPPAAALLPVSSSREGAVFRAKVNLLVEKWVAGPEKALMRLLMELPPKGGGDDSAREGHVEEFVSLVERDIEPLLPANIGGVFFGGGPDLTLAEVLHHPLFPAALMAPHR
jgi:glutathione S-transferase